jgi:hypothetical protein
VIATHPTSFRYERTHRLAEFASSIKLVPEPISAARNNTGVIDRDDFDWLRPHILDGLDRSFLTPVYLRASTP